MNLERQCVDKRAFHFRWHWTMQSSFPNDYVQSTARHAFKFKAAHCNLHNYQWAGFFFPWCFFFFAVFFFLGGGEGGSVFLTSQGSKYIYLVYFSLCQAAHLAAWNASQTSFHRQQNMELTALWDIYYSYIHCSFQRKEPRGQPGPMMN